MKAEELRIGNYYLDQNNDLCEVTPYVIEKLWKSKGNWVNSIPLTEEWLLKFGFENYALLENHFWIEPIRLICSENKIYFKFDSELIELRYVHQLQNLYHALTGEEIKIK